MKRIERKSTSAERVSFNAFSEERVMAFKSIHPKPNMSCIQEDHLRACFFNCINDAYAAGLATKNRKSKPDALGMRQLITEINGILDKDEKSLVSRKYLRIIGDRIKVLNKSYIKSRKK